MKNDMTKRKKRINQNLNIKSHNFLYKYSKSSSLINSSVLFEIIKRIQISREHLNEEKRKNHTLNILLSHS